VPWTTKVGCSISKTTQSAATAKKHGKCGADDLVDDFIALMYEKYVVEERYTSINRRKK
jgi:hypothetical protein